MQRILILLIALTATLICACGVTTDIYFDKDYSGSYKTTIDLQGLIDMVGSEGVTVGEQGDLDLLDDPALKNRYDSMMATVPGITNGQFTTSDDYVMTLSFDFESLEALNSFLNQMNDTDSEGETQLTDMGVDPSALGSFAAPTFELEGKTIMHTAEIPKPGDLGLEAEGMEGMDMDAAMAGVAGMVDYQINLSFRKKIKSVGGEGFDILSQEKKSVKTRVDMNHLVTKGSYKIAVQTK